MLEKAGVSARKALVEPSSGSTVTSLALASRVLHQNDDVCAFVSNKTEISRLRTLQFFGLKVSVSPQQVMTVHVHSRIEFSSADPCTAAHLSQKSQTREVQLRRRIESLKVMMVFGILASMKMRM